MASITNKTSNLDKGTAALLADCIGPFSWKRNAAEQKILDRTEEQFEPLLNEFITRSANYRALSKTNLYSSITFLGILIPGFTYLIYQTSKISTGSLNTWIVFLSSIFPLFSVFSNSKHNPDTQILNFANLIAKFHDIRIIGPLFEMLCVRNNQFTRLINNRYARIEDALIKTLPHITCETDVQLTSHQVNCLIKTLRLKNDKLRIAILYAMPFVGNQAALDAARRMAKQEMGNINPAVVKAAQKCLPGLEARVARLTSMETLLRPSSQQTHNDTLLRPVDISPETRPEELLRSSHNS